MATLDEIAEMFDPERLLEAPAPAAKASGRVAWTCDLCRGRRWYAGRSCLVCEGSGASFQEVECPACEEYEGRCGVCGGERSFRLARRAEGEDQRQRCITCKGRGLLISETWCPTCEGAGILSSFKLLGKALEDDEGKHREEEERKTRHAVYNMGHEKSPCPKCGCRRFNAPFQQPEGEVLTKRVGPWCCLKCGWKTEKARW